jgi:hypothetical protein
MVALGWGAVFERGEPRISRMGRMGCCASRDDGEGVGVRADQGGKGGVGPLLANGRWLGRWIGRSTGDRRGAKAILGCAVHR